MMVPCFTKLITIKSHNFMLQNTVFLKMQKKKKKQNSNNLKKSLSLMNKSTAL